MLPNLISIDTTKSYAARRRNVPKSAIRALSVIPGIGPSLATDLYLLGIQRVESLKGRSPEALYRGLCEQLGRPVDRCVLYAFRCAVYFASERDLDPAKLKWWLWMDGRLSPNPQRQHERHDITEKLGKQIT